MKLIVGLGNPGDRYAHNRHNIGAMTVDRIADRHRFSAWRRRFQGETAEGELDGVKALLLKPATYMNESGRSVGEAARFLKIEPADVIVVHDELDLLPGKLKLKMGGGNAGHNGLRSISAHIGNDYKRLRLGIGHPGHKDAVSGYVLHDFSRADEDWLQPLLDAIAAAAGRLASDEDGRFLSEVAVVLAPPKPRKGAEESVKPKREAPVAKTKGVDHPAGDRLAKRQSALTENVRRWLAAKSSIE